ncbi:MAG TPA: hypothetical protein VN363_02935, partial [Anaerolineales bacterium]|nr:hypothetical protein [Anaerolineales bacterium]
LPDWMDTPTPRRLRLDLENALDRWVLLAYFNWSANPDKISLFPNDFSLPDNPPCIAREFWTGGLYSLSSETAAEITIPPHGVRLFAARLFSPDVPAYLGGDIHISQGLEVSGWQVAETSDHHTLEISLERPGLTQGCIDLYLPTPPHQAFLNGKPLPASELQPRCYRFNLDFDGSAGILIQYS